MNKEILLRETAGIDRVGEYVRVAVPCTRGELPPERVLAVLVSTDKADPVQTQILKLWPDGSVKWLLTDFTATVSAGTSSGYRLVSTNSPAQAPVSVQVTFGTDRWTVATGVGTFELDARVFGPFRQVQVPGRDILSGGSACQLQAQDGSLALPIIEQMHLEVPGPLHAIVRISGHFDGPLAQGVRFSSRLHFFAGRMTVKLEFTLHNPHAASHPGGLWDLGDPGSVLFKGLDFTFPLRSVTEVHAVPERGHAALVARGELPFSLCQESSGGENWQSPVHRNRDGQVPAFRKGYRVEIDGTEAASGLRATPLVWCGHGDVGVSVVLPHFWQEFPKAVEVAQGSLRVSLFPSVCPDLHELQGGEQKTHAFWLDFSGSKDALAWVLDPLLAVASPADYRASGIFSDLPGEVDLVDRVASAQSFLAKRELVDEYGWRHFGEIYADHEAVYHQGNTVLISHYNNQYDFVAGAYRKFFVTADPAWRALAAELAAHVRDIDIYHTDLDREEYNHGLFWHTDHYVDAGLSTHRSYSCEQKSAYELHTGAGGPGPEHCYATGLAMHYFQTGHPDFKQAVIDLAEWELLALTGPQTVLAALKRGLGSLNLWRSVRGERRLFPRYPLTRGTGNAISTCLDAFEVGGGHKYLAKAQELIRHTLHPEDDLSCRDLLNAEIAWSYTVLLTAVAKFLDKKTELAEFDAGFAHARASLLAYARWMAEHEYPYLDKPEILEYPNETWAAQDLRKSVIFYRAARYADAEEQRQVFLDKARFFYAYVSNELPKHATSSLTRPLVLMLQNGWVGDRLINELEPVLCLPLQGVPGRPTPYLTLGAVIGRIGSELVQALKQTSIKRELAWLKFRLKS